MSTICRIASCAICSRFTISEMLKKTTLSLSSVNNDDDYCIGEDRSFEQVRTIEHCNKEQCCAEATRILMEDIKKCYSSADNQIPCSELADKVVINQPHYVLVNEDMRRGVEVSAVSQNTDYKQFKEIYLELIRDQRDNIGQLSDENHRLKKMLELCCAAIPYDPDQSSLTVTLKKQAQELLYRINPC